MNQQMKEKFPLMLKTERERLFSGSKSEYPICERGSIQNQQYADLSLEAKVTWPLVSNLIRRDGQINLYHSYLWALGLKEAQAEKGVKDLVGAGFIEHIGGTQYRCSFFWRRPDPAVAMGG